MLLHVRAPDADVHPRLAEIRSEVRSREAMSDVHTRSIGINGVFRP